MKHQTLDELQRVAAVHAEDIAPRALTRAERLERWADLLEADPDRRLNTLPGTEYEPEEVRRTMRRLHSPLSIATEDPVLRAAGLDNDTYGEGMRFFELSDWQLHGIVCYCHFGATMTADQAARRVRAAISGSREPSLFARLRHVISG
jgi:hypothetical protein